MLSAKILMKESVWGFGKEILVVQNGLVLKQNYRRREIIDELYRDKITC